MVDVVSFERERERERERESMMLACMLKLCACVFVFSCLELQSYFVEFKTYTMLCSLYTFLVYFNAVRSVLGC